MKKIAIVGVEGSGKTVMMAAMGEQWERPDERGYFLSPENAEAFGFSKSVMAVLRSGKWPNASSHDEMRTLAWSLQRRQGGNLEKIADISMLDYAGEVYRQAFGGEKREGYDEQVATLRSHVDEADVLIVLVNLSDIISGSMSDRRTRDAMWLTKSVLDYAREGKSRKPHAAIVFTQADSYREIISANGSEAATLKKYLPHVANLYGDVPIFAASAIDRTIIGNDGLPIPAAGFQSTGLKELMDWMIGHVVGMHQQEIFDDELERLSTGPSYCPSCGRLMYASESCPQCGCTKQVFIRYAMSEHLKACEDLRLNAEMAVEAFERSDWNRAFRLAVASKFQTAEVNYCMARMIIDGRLDPFFEENIFYYGPLAPRWIISVKNEDSALLHVIMMKFLDEECFRRKVGELRRRFMCRGSLLNAVMALPGILVSRVAGRPESVRRPSGAVLLFVFFFYIITLFIPMLFVPFFFWLYRSWNGQWEEKMRIAEKMADGCNDRWEAEHLVREES